MDPFDAARATRSSADKQSVSCARSVLQQGAECSRMSELRSRIESASCGFDESGDRSLGPIGARSANRGKSQYSGRCGPTRASRSKSEPSAHPARYIAIYIEREDKEEGERCDLRATRLRCVDARSLIGRASRLTFIGHYYPYRHRIACITVERRSFRRHSDSSSTLNYRIYK